MTIEHTFLAGTTIDYQKALFFDIMQSGNVYMGFARSDPMWGFSTLVKIDHTRTWPTNVMGQVGFASPDEDFYDNISDSAFTIPTDGQRVYIAYIDKNDSISVLSNFNILDSNSIGSLTLDYMNKEWCRIRGLNNEYLDFILDTNLPTVYDYYLLNYEQDIRSITQIQTVDRVDLPTIKAPVKLMYTASTTQTTTPTTAFGTNIVGDLERHINLFGETNIIGMTASFVTTGNGYIQDNSLDSAAITFFITTADGVIIQDGMKYIETIETNDEQSVVFSYPIVSEATQNSGRMKISNSINPTKLAVFGERFTNGMEVTDATPVPLVLNYLRTGMIHSSIFDVLGIIQIEPETWTKTTTVADVTSSLSGKYFTLYASDGTSTTDNNTQYYVWFDVNDLSTDPAVTGTGLEVNIDPDETADMVASKMATVISNANGGNDFTCVVTNNEVVIKNKKIGPVIDTVDSNTTFTIEIANEITFSRRIDTQATEELLLAVPEIDSEAIEVITIAENPDTTVQFAVTKELAIAQQYNFDLVRIKKIIPGTGAAAPTEEVYRQLFVCYKPKDSAGVVVTANTATHTDIFNTTEHSYDLGTMLYLVNNSPVYRKHLSSDEDFTLLI